MHQCRCGKECETEDAARGHVQFSSGDVNGIDHAPKGEKPEDWAQDLFGGFPDDADEDDESDVEDDADADADAEDVEDVEDDASGLYETLVEKSASQVVRDALGAGK